MKVLEKLHNSHKMPNKLYVSIRKNIHRNDIEELQQLAHFVEDLPIDLRRPLSMLIYEELYTSVDFLKKKPDRFIAWICPILKPRIAAPNECIYYENDELRCVYF